MKCLKKGLIIFGLIIVFGFAQQIEATAETQINPTEISPFAASDVQEFTLKNGESFEVAKYVLDIPNLIPYVSIDVKVKSGEQEAFLFEHGAGSYNDAFKKAMYGNWWQVVYTYGSKLAAGEPHVIKVTNYSAGEVTYVLTTNIYYRDYPIRG